MLHTNNGTIHKKEIRRTFGFAGEKFSAKVRLDTRMPGVPIILSKSVFINIFIWVRQHLSYGITAKRKDESTKRRCQMNAILTP